MTMTDLSAADVEETQAPRERGGTTTAPGCGASATAPVHGSCIGDEDGSLVTEYGLLAIVAATVAAAVIQWASDGALSTLFNALLRQARDIVGA